MISSFGRGFDSLQLHSKHTERTANRPSFLCVWRFSVVGFLVLQINESEDENESYHPDAP